MTFKELRYVRDHIDTMLPEDHNDHVDNWKSLLPILSMYKDVVSGLEIVLYELKTIVNKMRYVEYDTSALSSDVNYMIDAFDKAIEYFEMLFTRLGTPELNAKLSRLKMYRDLMEKVKYGDFNFSRNYNYFREAWLIIDDIIEELPPPPPPPMEIVYTEEWRIIVAEHELVYVEHFYYEMPYDYEFELKHKEEWYYEMPSDTEFSHVYTETW